MILTDVLDELGVAYAETGHHHCRPGWVQIDCPYCADPAGTWHLGLNISGRYANCWVCGYRSIIYALAKVSRANVKDIANLLGQVDELRIRDDYKKTGQLQIPSGIDELHPAHRRYLKSRNFDPDEISELWNVRGITIAARLSWRLFIPIQVRYETVSWTTRAIGKNASPRYISAGRNEESVRRNELLYGEDLAGHAITIVEGPTDAWRIGPGAVAIMGLNYSFKQIQRMKSYPVRVVCFDNSHDAQKRARKLCAELSMFPGETYHVQLSGSDPASSPKHEIQELRKVIS